LLLLKRGLAAHVAVEREVGDCGVFGYALTDVLEVVGVASSAPERRGGSRVASS